MREKLEVWHFNLALGLKGNKLTLLSRQKKGDSPLFPVEDAAKRLDGLQKLP